MEAFEAAVNANEIYENNKCYLKMYIMDDDSMTKSVLRWSFKMAKEFLDRYGQPHKQTTTKR
jgi:hypothetical protein